MVSLPEGLYPVDPDSPQGLAVSMAEIVINNMLSAGDGEKSLLEAGKVMVAAMRSMSGDSEECQVFAVTFFVVLCSTTAKMSFFNGNGEL